MKNCPDFEKSTNVIQHGLREFIIKNIEGESTEANDLIVIFGEVGLMRR